jgi:predicted TIM-barrel fold metal-dependent hydrolase
MMFKPYLLRFPILLVLILFLFPSCGVKPPFYETRGINVATNRITLDKKNQIKRFDSRIREGLQKGFLPIIDVEFHYGRRIEIEKLIERMDENGVALTWLMPYERLGSEESLKWNELYPDRFVPTTVGGDGPLWHKSDRGFLEKLGKDVLSGKYFAMGEFEARHYRNPMVKVNRESPWDTHMPVDSPTMEVVFELSSKTGIPFLLHHEMEDQLLPELERMLSRYPNAKVIWCHVGWNRNPKTWKTLPTADGVRQFLTRYPNLCFDFLQLQGGAPGPDAVMYDIYPNGVFSLNRKWKKVIEEFSDRFVLSSDINQNVFDKYDGTIARYRKVLLRQVNKEVAAKIAYKNAWKLMTGEDWVD